MTSTKVMEFISFWLCFGHLGQFSEKPEARFETDSWVSLAKALTQFLNN